MKEHLISQSFSFLKKPNAHLDLCITAAISPITFISFFCCTSYKLNMAQLLKISSHNK